MIHRLAELDENSTVHELIRMGVSTDFYAKLVMVADIEMITKQRFKGNTEKEADTFIETHYHAYKTNREYVMRDMYDHIEESW